MMLAELHIDDPRLHAAFCERLWLELTIAGRAVWSDEKLGESVQLGCLKWLNEMQHRVWGAHASQENYPLSQLALRIEMQVKEAPHLKSLVEAAWRDALEYVQAA